MVYSIKLLMKSLVRKIVAGPKNKTPYQDQELDLTYITDRLIAMAYPASGMLEKTFRNSIDDVAGYLNEYHPHNYLIVNVSSRPYDYAKFENRVL
jgi:phosphatidylinositol-3,4,5-trisphosphate 3-phosphatase and dual-specificity protein phosphatase PTEN